MPFDPSTDTCVICNCNQLNLLLEKRPSANLGLDVSYKIVQCPDCLSAFVSNPPRPEELGAVYDKHFFSTSQQDAPVNSSGEFTDAALEQPIIKNSLERVKAIRRLIPSGKLADIGCGKGFFLKAASKLFDVTGFELSPDAAEFGRSSLGLDIRCGDFEQASLSGEKFDIITLWDVLASLYDPREGLERVSTMLKDNGYLIMTVPDIDSRSFKISKKGWPLLIPPINLWYFSKKSIEKLLNKHGFELVDWRYDSKWVSGNFVIRKFGRITGLSFLDNEHLRIPFMSSMRLNLFDIATVVARKK